MSGKPTRGRQRGRKYLIYPNVTIGPGAQIGEFVVIGEAPRGRQPGELPTLIGANAVIQIGRASCRERV